LIDKVGRWELSLTESWIESDGPSVSAPKRRGFGTIVMEAMAERSVGGRVAASASVPPNRINDARLAH